MICSAILFAVPARADTGKLPAIAKARMGVIEKAQAYCRLCENGSASACDSVFTTLERERDLAENQWAAERTRLATLGKLNVNDELTIEEPIHQALRDLKPCLENAELLR